MAGSTGIIANHTYVQLDGVLDLSFPVLDHQNVADLVLHFGFVYDQRGDVAVGQVIVLVRHLVRHSPQSGRIALTAVIAALRLVILSRQATQGTKQKLKV